MKLKKLVRRAISSIGLPGSGAPESENLLFYDLWMLLLFRSFLCPHCMLKVSEQGSAFATFFDVSLSWSFLWPLKKLPAFVLHITNLIVVYSGLDHFGGNFASHYIVFLPHYFCIKSSHMLKCLLISHPVRCVCNFNESISSQICGKHQEVYQKFFFLLWILFKCMWFIFRIFS